MKRVFVLGALLTVVSLGARAHAVNIRDGAYLVRIDAGATTAAATARFAGLAKRVAVTTGDLGTTCAVQLRTESGVALFASDPLSTGTTLVSLADLPVGGACDWLVTAGAALATTRTVSIVLTYDANRP